MRNSEQMTSQNIVLFFIQIELNIFIGDHKILRFGSSDNQGYLQNYTQVFFLIGSILNRRCHGTIGSKEMHT